MPNVRPLPPDLEEIARTQLNEDPKRLENDLTHIKDWLSKQPHLTARMDDQFLVAYLRGCKYSLEQTKEKLDFYYTIRSTVGFFNDRDPMRPEIQKILNLGAVLPLREPDEHGRRVLLARTAIHDPNEVNITDLFKVNSMLIDYLIMKDDRFNIAGAVSVADVSNVTLGHIVQFTPTMMKLMMKCSEDGYAIRTKGINYIHTYPAFDIIFNFFKTFAKDKLKKRMFVHGDDMDSLYKNVPQKILPKEYGGEAGSIDDLTIYWKKEMESFRDWLLDDAKYKSDESKRPGKPKTYEDLFGIEESFRQLSID